MGTHCDSFKEFDSLYYTVTQWNSNRTTVICTEEHKRKRESRHTANNNKLKYLLQYKKIKIVGGGICQLVLDDLSRILITFYFLQKVARWILCIVCQKKNNRTIGSRYQYPKGNPIARGSWVRKKDSALQRLYFRLHLETRLSLNCQRT